MATLSYGDRKYEIGIETIEPELAQKYLKTVKLERKLSDAHVRVLSNKLKAKHWEHLNGDSVCFDMRGNLVDGMHRLRAVISSGLPIVTFVIRGVKQDIYFGKDDGKKRSISDTLGMLGYENVNTLAATLNLMYLWKQDHLSWAKPPGGAMDHRNAVELMKKHNDFPIHIIETLKLYRDQRIRVFNGTGMVGFYYYVFSHIDHEICTHFFRQLIGLEGCEQTPVYYLQARLLRSVNAQPRKDKMSWLDQRAAIQKTWNLFVQNQRTESLRSIAWKYNEEFPPILAADGSDVSYAGLFQRAD